VVTVHSFWYSVMEGRYSGAAVVLALVLFCNALFMVLPNWSRADDSPCRVLFRFCIMLSSWLDSRKRLSKLSLHSSSVLLAVSPIVVRPFPLAAEDEFPSCMDLRDCPGVDSPPCKDWIIHRATRNNVTVLFTMS
jgi:hypothetical protein